MSTSPQTNVKVEEEVPLNTVAGSGDTEDNPQSINTRRIADFFRCDDPNHRKLAIWSIICGCSCIGVRALINSVKAKETNDPRKAEIFSKKAKKLSIISISIWVAILVSIPVLMALISYVLTLSDD